MTIDDLGRSAATAARAQATREVDPTMMLRQLHRTRRTRTALTVAAVVAVLAVGGVVVARAIAPSTTALPGSRPSTSQTCPPFLTCLADGRYRVDLPVPVTLTVPSNYYGSLQLFAPDSVEDYRSDVDSAGMTVMEDAHGVLDDASFTADPSSGTTAESMATWFTHRPFLQHPTMQQVTVDGRTGWLVTGSLKPGAPLTATKNGSPAAPTFRDGGATAGLGQQLPGEYVLLDTPGAGVTVIWFWAVSPTADRLVGATTYLDGLAFG